MGENGNDTVWGLASGDEMLWEYATYGMLKKR